MEKELYFSIRKKLKNVIENTKFEGHVFCVGGCVRDEIMGQEIKDIDLVIDLPDGGIDFAVWMRDNNYTHGEIVIYSAYGTAMFKLAEYPWIDIECVQTRSEEYNEESRNPRVNFGTIDKDCIRRDLTINALYWNISKEKLYDYTKKGLKDIKDHIIRTTDNPKIIFSDDPLRMLRCIRFATRYGWEIEEKTYQGIKKNADRLEIISQERITEEFNKMLCCDNYIEALMLLKDTGLLDIIIPEFHDTYEMTQNKYHCDTVWKHTLSVLDNIKSDSLTLRLAALLHDIGKIKTRTMTETGVHFYDHELVGAEIAEEILRKMKYQGSIIKYVPELIKNHMIAKGYTDDPRVKPKTLRRWQYKYGKDMFYDLLTLIDADNKSHAPEYCMPNQCTRIKEQSEYMEESGEDMFHYRLPVNGDDVIEYKNIEQGPEVKKYLSYLLKLAFSNPHYTRDELLGKIKNLTPEQI